jgi:GTP-binding protein EngB required for normal cell division
MHVSRTGGDGALYTAACAARAGLRGAASLLVQDRADVAAAAGADGVVLTPTAVPPAVAKRALAGGGGGGGGIVVSLVDSAGGAGAAAAAGAGALLLRPGAAAGGGFAALVRAARDKLVGGESVSVLLDATNGGNVALDPGGADGLAVTLAEVGGAARALGRGGAGGAAAPRPPPPAPPAPQGEPSISGAAAALAAAAASPGAAALRSAQRELLPRVLAFLQRAVPGLAEARALAAAAASLDAPFLVVVAGEFNSGKSTLINALLGGRYLADGFLPTTNEIAVLKFRGESGGDNGGSAPSPDEEDDTEGGAAVRRLPAPLLRHATVVDTPGTNAILERQQRLTEEFIPRADLVLFTLSADRAFTESEAGFLRYIRRWGKKVLFAVNKADAMASPADADAVAAFVAGAAADVLGVADPVVLPVSARLALEAKEAAAGGGGGQGGRRWRAGEPAPRTPDPAALAASHAWAASRFAPLEATVARFLVDGIPGGADPALPLDGGGGGGAPAPPAREALAVGAGEGLRLKLETPLFLAAALLAAAGEALQGEAAAAQADVASIASVSAQLAAFAGEMERDAASQRTSARRAVARGAARAAAAVDDTLTLSNWSGLFLYLVGAGKASALPASARLTGDAALASAASDLAAAAADHRAWLDSNVGAQRASYRAFVEERAAGLGVEVGALDAAAAAAKEVAAPAPAVESSAGDEDAPPQATTALLTTTTTTRGAASAAVARFDAPAAALLLEEELREAALATAAGTAAAAVLGAGLTAILPGFAEDALALALAAAVAYLALLNLPLRRAEAKGKVARAADAYAADVEAAFESELRADLADLEAEVGAWAAPLAAAAAVRAAAAAASAADAVGLAEEVAGLRAQAAGL